MLFHTLILASTMATEPPISRLSHRIFFPDQSRSFPIYKPFPFTQFSQKTFPITSSARIINAQLPLWKNKPCPITNSSKRSKKFKFLSGFNSSAILFRRKNSFLNTKRASLSRKSIAPIAYPSSSIHRIRAARAFSKKTSPYLNAVVKKMDKKISLAELRKLLNGSK